MQKIRTLIVDDEAPAREGIAALLREDTEIEVIGWCSNGKDALQVIRGKNIDLLFLDVQMPGRDGFELLAMLQPDEIPVVVFVTAYDEYALQAFQVHALDYLLKSYSDEQFGLALARAKQIIREKQTAQITERLLALVTSNIGPSGDKSSHPNPKHDYLKRLVIKEGGRIFFINVDEIDWIESADYYVCLHVGKKSHLLRETMRNLEKRLDPAQFQRVHRSTIVNLDRIKELQPYQYGDYIIILHNATELKLSRSYRAKLEATLGNPI